MRWMAVLLVALVGVASANDATNTPSIRIAEPAPAFRARDLDGKEVTAASFKGKTVLLVFWTTWAEPCVEQLPALIELQRQYSTNDFTVLGVSLDDKGAAHVKQFAAEKKLNFPILMGDTKLATDYGPITGLPTLILIERRQFILQRYVGVTGKDAIEADIKVAFPK
jgi:peroxiredoxin